MALTDYFLNFTFSVIRNSTLVSTMSTILCLQYSYTLNKMYYRFAFHPWGMVEMTSTRKDMCQLRN